MLYCYHLYCNLKNRLYKRSAGNTFSHLKIFYAQCWGLLLYKIHIQGLQAFFRQNLHKKYRILRLRLEKKLKKRRCTVSFLHNRDAQLYYTPKIVKEIPAGQLKLHYLIPKNTI